MYDHIYPEQIEVKVTSSDNQTIIELRLLKQHELTTWPQLHSRHSSPITPDRKNLKVDPIDDQIHSFVNEPEPYDLPIKKTRYEFTETMDNKAIVRIDVKKINSCHVQFTETNFTATFYSTFVDVL